MILAQLGSIIGVGGGAGGVACNAQKSQEYGTTDDEQKRLIESKQVSDLDAKYGK